MRFRKRPAMEPVDDPSDYRKTAQTQEQRRVRLKAQAQKAVDYFAAMPPERQRAVMRALLQSASIPPQTRRAEDAEAFDHR